ncbi:hypothetical protein [Candidatus Avelusimicrobium stercoris]|uniref:hypothetical protein n=1 Tax=Candidatus Avelusimicrobium stercoris TaxID=1947924 RepID=UPI003D12111A
MPNNEVDKKEQPNKPIAATKQETNPLTQILPSKQDDDFMKICKCVGLGIGAIILICLLCKMGSEANKSYRRAQYKYLRATMEEDAKNHCLRTVRNLNAEGCETCVIYDEYWLNKYCAQREDNPTSYLGIYYSTNCLRVKSEYGVLPECFKE